MWTAITIALTLATGFIAFQISPRPWIPLIRYSFDKGGRAAAATFTPYVPNDVEGRRDISYAAGDPDARFDVFYPSAAATNGEHLPTVVWVHGGGWISGTKDGLAGYQKILAHEGFTSVSVEYSHAPESRYPTPLRQLNEAMGYLSAHADELHIDRNRLVLAGDSAGAQIVAQYANIVSEPSYASLVGIQPMIARSQLSGVVLYCGAFDLNNPAGNGTVQKAGRAMLWAYLGDDNFDDPKFETLHLVKYLTGNYPPTFISDGNLDLLLPQSERLAVALKERQVRVDTLFFPPDGEPKTNHEYQFLFNTEVAHLSFERMVQFLNGVVGEPKDEASKAQ